MLNSIHIAYQMSPFACNMRDDRNAFVRNGFFLSRSIFLQKSKEILVLLVETVAKIRNMAIVVVAVAVAVFLSSPPSLSF